MDDKLTQQDARVRELPPLWRCLDADTAAEIDALEDRPDELYDCFYRDLSFGTGGLRGIMGVGPNRMNLYTVRKATFGLARYLLQVDPEAARAGVVIAHDSRHHSGKFAREAAGTLLSQGIKAYVFPSLRPTPELSFAVRELGAAAGIVITASHNPSAYNGYKIYSSNGVQILPEAAAAIAREIGGFSDMRAVARLPETGEALLLGEALDSAYVSALLAQVLNPEDIASQADMPILYTPLHGAGEPMVRRTLAGAGFTNVQVVPEQVSPDGDFPTVALPNPEDPAAFSLALQQAKQLGSELILGTDPDADRLGVFVRMEDRFASLSGNQLGCLMLSYLLENGKWGTRPLVVKTIVSTGMARAICADHGVKLLDVLTGFKYIGDAAERHPECKFVFGFEESFGYLTGDAVRDKDAVGAALLTAEMAAHYRARGQTLLDALAALYRKYGYYKECLQTLTLPGVSGLARLDALMARLRAQPPETLGGLLVVRETDYLQGGDLPISDVLLFELERDAWVCVRPSGTEPKLKLYAGVRETSAEASAERLEALSSDVAALIEQAGPAAPQSA